jgi:hypothetical protein
MELPSISNNSYISNSVGADSLLSASGILTTHARRVASTTAWESTSPQQLTPMKAPMPASAASFRIVRVVIADTDQNLPLDLRVLYSGGEKFTDLTDQELFFEIPIKDFMDRHNQTRVKTLDKKATDKAGRDVFLEPARIRDLKMVVVTIAEF